jgi:hypothetical protein
MEKRYICSRCNQEIKSHEKGEHDDWHFAQDLDNRDNGAVAIATPIQSPTMPDRKSSSASPTKSKLQPVDSHRNATPTNGSATKKRRHVAHVNAVDKAAALRAQSEVCIRRGQLIPAS